MACARSRLAPSGRSLLLHPELKEHGEVKTGRISPADCPTLRRFLAGFAGQEVRAALEATTGWRFVCEG